MSGEELPLCPVCNFDYGKVVPLVFPCGHTVCQKCVNNLVSTHYNYNMNYNVPCPVCRKTSKMKNLPKNFGLLEAIDKIKKLEERMKSPRGSLKCTGCGKMERESDLFICRNCVQTSLNFDITDVVAVQTPPDLKSSVFCGSCAVLIHIPAGHETFPFFSTTSRFQFESHLTGVSLQKKELEEKMNTIDKNYDQLKQTISRSYKEIEKMTEMMRKSKSSEIQQEFAERISEEFNKLSTYATSVNECISNGNAQYKVGLDKLVATNLQDEVEKCQELPEKEPKFVCSGCGKKETKDKMLCCRKCSEVVESLMSDIIDSEKFKIVDTNSLPICMPCVFTNHFHGDKIAVKFADVLEKYRIVGEMKRFTETVTEISKKIGEILDTSEKNISLVQSYDKKITNLLEIAAAIRGLPEQDEVFSRLDSSLNEANQSIESLHTHAEFDRDLLENVVKKKARK